MTYWTRRNSSYTLHFPRNLKPHTALLIKVDYSNMHHPLRVQLFARTSARKSSYKSNENVLLKNISKLTARIMIEYTVRHTKDCFRTRFQNSSFHLITPVVSFFSWVFSFERNLWVSTNSSTILWIVKWAISKSITLWLKTLVLREDCTEIVGLKFGSDNNLFMYWFWVM